jgi:hypothetical protein
LRPSLLRSRILLRHSQVYKQERNKKQVEKMHQGCLRKARELK